MQYYYLEVKGWEAYFAPGEMAERSNAAVLKTVEAQVSGGSNPSLSATYLCKQFIINCLHFYFSEGEQ